MRYSGPWGEQGLGKVSAEVSSLVGPFYVNHYESDLHDELTLYVLQYVILECVVIEWFRNPGLSFEAGGESA